MLKQFVAALFAVIVVVVAGCSDGRAEEPDRPVSSVPVKAKSFGSAQDKPVVRVKMVAVKQPAIYLHQFKQTVIIVRDEAGLGLEPRWESFDKLLTAVFGELKLNRPRTIEFVWTTNPKQDLFVAFHNWKAGDPYVRTTIQVAHLAGKKPPQCRDLVQSSFLVALYALESGNRNYANLRALIEPRLAYAFDVPKAQVSREVEDPIGP